MWRNVGTAYVVHEALSVVVFVRAQRYPMGITERTSHVGSGFPFCFARGRCHLSIDKQTGAVLHQNVAHIAQLGRCALALLEQQGILVRLDSCVSRPRFSPWKSTLGLRPSLLGGSSSSFGR